jgi:hypothetical protein
MVLGGILLNAVTEKIYFPEQEIKLEFANIKIKDIDFYNGKEIIIIHSRKDEVQIEQVEELLALTSKHEAKVKLKLPADKAYSFVKDNANCYFTAESMIIDTGDEVVKFTEKKLEVIENGKTKVVIGENGILVEDEDERVEIGSEGIIVEGDENTQLTGFWGQLLGSFIKAVVKTSISFAGKRPEMIAKYIINEEDDDDAFIYSFGFNNYGSYDEEQTFEEDYYPSANTRLKLDNINGSIVVKQWDEDRMNIRITKKANEESEFEKVKLIIDEGSNFSVRTEHLEKKPKVSVEYEINIPANVDLDEIVSSNGFVKLTGTSGNTSVLTSNGFIEIKDHTGNILTRTSNGRIEVNGLKGEIKAVTSNGRIDLEDISGSASANTSNASIEITNCPSVTSARTSNAIIELEIVELADDLEVVTSNAKVKLEISAHLDADLMASTNNGRIIRDLPRLETETEKNNYLKGKLGKGGHLLDIRTSNANIYLETLEDLF